jgi:hypothetical protein
MSEKWTFLVKKRHFGKVIYPANEWNGGYYLNNVFKTPQIYNMSFTGI